MENYLNLSTEDSGIRDLFKGKKVGNKMTITVRVALTEVTPNHVSATVEAVDGKVTFEGEASESSGDSSKAPVLEVMKS